MDAHEMNHKLHYVQELLDDLWHYHQSGTHTCPCNVCTKKQSLARSIISKASQEVTLIVNSLEITSNVGTKVPLTNDLHTSCDPTLPSEQESELELVGGSLSEARQLHSGLDTNHDQKSREPRISLLVRSDSLRDSGINTSPSSQSTSPACGRCKLNKSQSFSKHFSNENSESGFVELSQTAESFNNCSHFILNNNTTHEARDKHSPNRQTLPQIKCLSELDNEFINTHLLHLCRNSSPHTHKNLLGYHFPKQVDITSTDCPSSSLCLPHVLLPFPIVIATSDYAQDLEKYHKLSQRLVDISKEHMTCEENPPVKTSKSSDGHKYLHASTSVQNETNDEQLEECTEDAVSAELERSCSIREHCLQIPSQDGNFQLHSRQNMFNCEPLAQNKQPCTSDEDSIAPSDHTDKHHGQQDTGLSNQSINLKTDHASCSDKTSFNHEEHQKQQHQVLYIKPEHQMKELQNSTLSSEHTSQQIDQLPHLCSYIEDNISSHSSIYQLPHVDCQTCEIYSCAGQLSDNLHEAGCMWRPWETKDIILGLISSDEDSQTLVTPSNNLSGVKVDTIPAKVNESSGDGLSSQVTGISRIALCVSEVCNSVPGNDSVSCLLQEIMTQKATKHKDSTLNINEENTSQTSSSSGNTLETSGMNNVKLSVHDSPTHNIHMKHTDNVNADITPGRLSSKNTGSHSQLGKFENKHMRVDEQSYSPASKHLSGDGQSSNPANKHMLTNELSTSTERSLKCLSNVQSPRNNRRSSLLQTYITETKLPYICNDKENEITVKNPKCSKSSFSQANCISYEKDATSMEHSQLQKKDVTNTEHSQLQKKDVTNIEHSQLQKKDVTNTEHSQLQSQYYSTLDNQPFVNFGCKSEPKLAKPVSIKTNGLVQVAGTKSSNKVVSGDCAVPVKSVPRWGAPAVPDSCSSSDHPEKNRSTKSEQIHQKKIVPKPTGEEFEPNSTDAISYSPTSISHIFNKSDGSNKKANRSYKNLEINDISEEITLEKNGRYNSMNVWKINAITHDITNLNQTLPTCKRQQECNNNLRLTAMNKSYDANQSFPKMSKSQHAAYVIQEDPTAASVGRHVTDLHQISPAKLAPRNRRSVFGLSSPDHLKNQTLQESDDDESSDDGGNSPVIVKHQVDVNDFSYLKHLWSHLDVSDAIGCVPSIQEVLFNCVTNSLCIVDPDRNGKIISVNESFQFLIGVHEKVLGQRIFRFIKFRDSLSQPDLSLPQSFVLADGQLANVTGKMALCVNASGEHKPVSVWTLPFHPQPKLTVCVIGVSVCLQAEVCLSQSGTVLMYSQPFEDILGLTEDKEVSQFLDIDLSKAGRAEHKILQAKDGCRVPVTVTVTSSRDTSMEDETLDKEIKLSNGLIYSAVISVYANMSGLLVVGPDGIIESCDKNYFRIHFGYSQLEGKHQLYDLLSDITQVSRTSSQSSPVLLQRKSSTNLALADVNCLRYRTGVSMQHMEQEELLLPESCFSNEGMQDSDTEYSDDADDHSACKDMIASDPFQTSTPYKTGKIMLNGKQKKVSLESGIYTAQFLHGRGYTIRKLEFHIYGSISQRVRPEK